MADSYTCRNLEHVVILDELMGAALASTARGSTWASCRALQRLVDRSRIRAGSGGVRTTAGADPSGSPAIPGRARRWCSGELTARASVSLRPELTRGRSWSRPRRRRTVGAARPALAPASLIRPVRRFVAARGPASRRPTAGRGSGLALARRAVGRVRRHYRGSRRCHPVGSRGGGTRDRHGRPRADPRRGGVPAPTQPPEPRQPAFDRRHRRPALARGPTPHLHLVKSD